MIQFDSLMGKFYQFQIKFTENEADTDRRWGERRVAAEIKYETIMNLTRSLINLRVIIRSTFQGCRLGCVSG